MRSLAEALIKSGRIKTTEAKAKELRPYIEKLVTRAKINNQANQRLLVSKLGTAARVKKLFTEIAPKYLDRAGGYTRVVKLAPRPGYHSNMAIIEFV
jgi:large subunit ribosomal protein L17